MIGVTQLTSEWGLDMKGNMCADSSAALGIAKRRGSGKMRHVKIGTLWIQEKNQTGDIQYTKVQESSNPADLMTKNVNRRRMSTAEPWTRWQHYTSNTSKKDGLRTENSPHLQTASDRPASAEEECKDILYGTW